MVKKAKEIEVGEVVVPRPQPLKLQDIFGAQFQGSKEIVEVFQSAQKVGNTVGDIFSLLGGKGPRCKGDIAKAGAIIGGVVGKFVEGVTESTEHHDRVNELPSETTNRMKEQIAEMEAAKELPVLEKRYKELVNELGQMVAQRALEQKTKGSQGR